MVDLVAGWIRDVQQVTVLSGAGVSAEGGVREFHAAERAGNSAPAELQGKVRWARSAEGRR